MHGLHQSTWVGFAGNDKVKVKPNTTTLNFSKIPFYSTWYIC